MYDRKRGHICVRVRESADARFTAAAAAVLLLLLLLLSR
jgi:hypothetical protein